MEPLLKLCLDLITDFIEQGRQIGAIGAHSLPPTK
jgi:hypothetical protein